MEPILYSDAELVEDAPDEELSIHTWRAEQLRRLGYAQQLLRAMGGFANFALSFSIISVLTGAVTLYGYGLRFGGPLEMTLGWPLVSLLTLPVAASLAQLASSYPTASTIYCADDSAWSCSARFSWSKCLHAPTRSRPLAQWISAV